MIQVSKTKADKLLLIIGNGFDIDLGLKTSYKSFVESRYWPCQHRLYKKEDIEKYDGTDCLHDILHENTNTKSWYDLEAILAEYATTLCGYKLNCEISDDLKQRAQDDRTIYDNLIKSLSSYLIEIQKSELNVGSVAAIVLNVLINSVFDVKVFSFNYTDINAFASKLGIKEGIDVTYMHGNLRDGIILGIESNMDFCPLYRYMCKEYSHLYQSRFLSNELHDVKHIVIFGHSLSAIDYHYFQRFFSEQSRDGMTNEDKKHITIFTYDEKSAWDIRDQLRNMNNKRLDLLYGQNVFDIIRTDGTDEEKFSNFCRYISELGQDYR